MSKDYYEILGVPRDATPVQIKKAYRRKSKTAHPDRGGTTEEMQALNRAYEVLSDPRKREIYDMRGDDGVNAANKIAEEASNKIMTLWDQMLDADPGRNDFKEKALELMQMAELEMKDETTRLTAKLKVLEGRRKTSKHKTSNIDLFETLLEVKITKINTSIDTMKTQLIVIEEARSYLNGWDLDFSGNYSMSKMLRLGGFYGPS